MCISTNMGRLSITVHSADLCLPVLNGNLHPRVTLIVDDRYTFHTKSRTGPSTTFDETFHVSSIHRLAVIEVCVAHLNTRSRLISGLPKKPLQQLMGGKGFMEVVKSAGSSGGGGGGGGGGSGGGGIADNLMDGAGIDGSNANVLIGRCFICLRRLVENTPQTRTFFLGTISRKRGGREERFPNPRWENPEGVAGTITLTLKLEGIGYPMGMAEFSSMKEEEAADRLVRLFLRHEPTLIPRMDLLCSNVREPSETADDLTWEMLEREMMLKQNPLLSLGEGGLGGNAVAAGEVGTASGGAGSSVRQNSGFPSSSVRSGVPSGGPAYETFDEMITRVCERRGWEELTTPMSATIVVEGCSNLNLQGLENFLIKDVFVVVRSPLQSFSTPPQPAKTNPVVWVSGGPLKVIDYLKWTMQVVLLGKGVSGVIEIGRTLISFGALTEEHPSTRNLFLCSFENPLSPTIRGVVHLSVTPHGFGTVPTQHTSYVDHFYERLSKFFRRYDIPRVPEVDALVQSRVEELEELMQDLVADYGREPGTVTMIVHVKQLRSLQETYQCEMDKKAVLVRLTLGEVSITTRPLLVREFVDTEVDECFEFDVVRETDMLRIDVIKATGDRALCGTTFVSFLNIQRGVENARHDELVANPGEKNSFPSGIVDFSLRSKTMGHDFEVDLLSEAMYTGRLNRYLFRRMPESLIRVSSIVSTVFDMETFLANLSVRFGEEDPTLAIFFTVTGCRNVKYRFGKSRQPYVMVRSGIHSQTIRVKHNSGMDYFGCCEFYFDRLEKHEIQVVLVESDEPHVLAYTSIPVGDAELERMYEDYVPLKNKKGQVVGSIGVKYTIRNLSMIDTTRVEVMKRKAAMNKGLQDFRAVSDFPHTRTLSKDGDVSLGGGRQQTGTGTGGNQVVRAMKGILKMRRRLLGRGKNKGGGGGGGGEMAGLAASLNSTSNTLPDAPVGGAGHHHHLSESFQGDSFTSLSDMEAQAASSSLTNRLNAGGGQNVLNQLILDFDDFDANATPSHHAGGTVTHSRTSSLNRACDEYAARIQGIDFEDDEQELAMFRESSSGVPPPHQFMGANTDLAALSNRTMGAHLQSRAGISLTIGQANFGFELSALPPPPPPPQMRKLHVRLFYCSRLEGNQKQAPDPFVVLSTVSCTHYSTTKEATLNPRYDEVFEFPLLHQEESALRISVFTHTSLGIRLLGHCVLSLKNIQHRQGITRRVGLVMEPHTRSAYEQGYVCLSLMGEGFGLDYAPRVDSEMTLRERLREYLEEEAPEQQHRLEWLVGEYLTRDTVLLSALKSKGSAGRFSEVEVEVPLHVRIKQVNNLFVKGWRVYGKCMVRVLVNQKKVGKTHWVSNSRKQPIFKFDETLHIRVVDPQRANLTLEVMIQQGSHRCAGECCIPCISDKRGKQNGWTRRHVLVAHAQTLEAMPSGYITVAISKPDAASSGNNQASFLPSFLRSGTTFFNVLANKHDDDDDDDDENKNKNDCAEEDKRGESKKLGNNNTTNNNDNSVSKKEGRSMGEEEEGTEEQKVEEEADNAQYQRLIRYYMYYKRDDLWMAAVRYATIASAELHIRKLEEIYGPEPQQLRLRLVVLECRELQVVKPKPREMAVVVRLGLQEYVSPRVVAVDGFEMPDAAGFACELEVGLPSLDMVELVVVQYRHGKPQEVGRTLFTMQHVKRNESKTFRQPLLFRGEMSSIVGTLTFTAFSDDFGEDSSAGGMMPSSTSDGATGRGDMGEHEADMLLFQRSSTMMVRQVLSDSRAIPEWSSSAPPGMLVEFSTPTLLKQVGERIFGGAGSPQTPSLGSNAFEHGASSSSFASPMFASPMGFETTATTTTTSIGGVNHDSSNMWQKEGSSNVFEEAGRCTEHTVSTAAAEKTASSTGAKDGGGLPTTVPKTAAVITLDSFVGLKIPNRDEIQCIIYDPSKNVLLKTKFFTVEPFRVIREEFIIKELRSLPSLVLTLSIRASRTIGSVEVSRSQFCLQRCSPQATTQRQIRLFDVKTNRFLGLCVLKIRLPALPEMLIKELHPRPFEYLKIADQITDDVASIVWLYQPAFLSQLDVMVYRSNDVNLLHDHLRDHLIPKSSGTSFLGVCGVDISANIVSEKELKERLYISVTSDVEGTRPSVVYANNPPILGLGKRHKLPYTLLRVDLTTPLNAMSARRRGQARFDKRLSDGEYNNAVTIRVGVCHTPLNMEKGGREIGRSVISLRALRSPNVYSPAERVSVPLVSVTEGRNEVEAEYVGEVTLMALPLVSSRYSQSLLIKTPANFNREVLHQYYRRLRRFSAKYDATLLLELHYVVYEQGLLGSGEEWESNLANFLKQLVLRWGPEPHEDVSIEESARLVRRRSIGTGIVGDSGAGGEGNSRKEAVAASTTARSRALSTTQPGRKKNE